MKATYHLTNLLLLSLYAVVTGLAVPASAQAQQQGGEALMARQLQQLEMEIERLTEERAEHLAAIAQLNQLVGNTNLLGDNTGPAAALDSNVIQRALEEIQSPRRPIMNPVDALHSWSEIAFSCAVLIFGLLLVAVQAWLTFRGKLTELAAFRLIGLTIVITAGLFVIPAGYSQNQMTPLMGLLGAIAGYLLGREGADKKPV